MSGNTSLTGFCIDRFTRLSSIEGIAKAPALRDFMIEDTPWDKIDFPGENARTSETLIAGKHKPLLTVAGNEKRIENYVRDFEKLKNKYRGVPYKTAFPG